ncbi:MAG: hypothetical protein KY446_04595 [Proteobacteria bacterium]|nr:hypothetical protein [Pseudomonadota bacterium]MBW3617020.1 hypothetical protein [Pseudomonadota bacterium]
MLKRFARLGTRLLFALAVAVLLHEAIEPSHEPGLVIAKDDLEHGLWAYGLTILGVAAFPRTRALLIGGVLLVLSAAAEGVQPLVGRSAEWSDWLGSAAGVGAALAPMLLLWIRERVLRGRASPTDRS